MQYSTLATLFEALSATSSRLEKTKLLADFLQKQQVDDLQAVLLLLQGKVFSDWEEHKLGVAGKLVFKGLATATGHSEEKIKDMFTELGDIGETAKKATSGKKQQTLFSTPLT
jgi:DNA ligase-1